MADSEQNPLLTAAASAAGACLRTTFGALSMLRRTAKPLHPHGEVHAASIHRYGTTPPVGVPWVDEPGSDDAIVRFSRATGLPPRLPDVLGIALRIRNGPADLLFATTGRRGIARFVLQVRREALVAETAYTTLLPYRGASGPLLLAVFPNRDGGHLSLRLAVSGTSGPWREFGTVLVDSEPGTDELVSFDPICNPLPDLPPYEWVARLREGAYAAAREHRGADPVVSEPAASTDPGDTPSRRARRSAAQRG
jgi:hypothetical protein